jgi:hypothetical protein
MAIFARKLGSQSINSPWGYFLSTTLIAVFHVPIFAQFGQLQGRVVLQNTDGSTKPVAGAVIDVYRTDKDESHSSTSDQEGRFNFMLPSEGSYVIAVSFPSAEPAVHFNVKVGQRAYTLTLTKGNGRRLSRNDIVKILATDDKEAERQKRQTSLQQPESAADIKAELRGAWDVVLRDKSRSLTILFTVASGSSNSLTALIEMDAEHSAMIYNLITSGSSFSGSFVDAEQTSGIIEGTLSGGQISGTFRIIAPEKRTLKFTGTRSTLGGTLAERKVEKNKPKPKIDSAYDRFKDRTTVVLDGGNLTTGGYDITNVKFVCTVQGQETHGQAPLACSIVIKQLSMDWKFRSSKSLNLILDSQQRMDLGQMLYMSVPIPLTSTSVKEEMIVSVPYKTIVRMAAAIKLEVQAGAVEFEFADTQLTALRAFIGYFN